MPEAIAIFIVSMIVVGLYVMAWVQSRDPARTNPQQEQARLQQQMGWLEERLARAQRENWSEDMVAGIATERAAAMAEWEKLSGRKD